ncbi:MAG: hypothetical protein A3C43_12435 [Candidatus Schekmanbacteria bacterium RIFCSPHIGHO2_02_FULL_38_11]|uniref:Lipoprotein n=1 Tax=Candidatus Schekmanbacteria bacterium RIFCSPLOWO2_12_FULL_38_15 TaxID=1817883 RepID=A0A1F7SHW9_9BACT|nr:MAG: hypothetical protein A2043_04190 [Candidatus Schekmanbacteria bacterium GWA2_38_9]OGL50847.1 MAG: hypothetical protein A3H37_03285 [Candidatus Schekmanbacteria bacterium RIFCSPLOWO2_02_FULL_38_14]OGL53393.1 MAG: hypothetical protein A3G31_07780 [Candidatus Schekmanbacteria bacterium RIFCSPLOWO2_12_FULL_38_15]OGL55745.1 MAG: hypothetical protein A3C43_12435 [Candidatus Schekmanbacteria bacterium RIFCSPHIGHO2_02_FULL_38_11]
MPRQKKIQKLFAFLIIFFVIYGCSGKNDNRGSILIGSIRSDGKVAETKIYVYKQGDHTKEVTFGYSGLDIFVPIGTYDLKIDWRGTTKWLDNVKIEKYSKVKEQIVFPLGRLIVKVSNTDGSPADASVKITPIGGENGIDVQKNDKGELVSLNVKDLAIKVGSREDEIMPKLNPEFKRSEPTKEGESGKEGIITYYYRILGTNIDLTFSKSDDGSGNLKNISYDEKIAAGIAGEEIELNPGEYDVRVEHERITKWIRNVKVSDKQLTEQSISFPSGKIIITSDIPEQAKEAQVAVYLEGRYEVMEKGGKIGEEILIVPGRYDILITLNNKKHWIRGIEVNDKSVISKKINL